ncbi:uncharacterized protein LOC143045176 [Mytilus galloprovincialis]|uniref:uncharacterized protein LOC143045176 n=1 Tax=Mytilus galloprovincialis TaxID=29158 RepID=UPI003F7BA898
MASFSCFSDMCQQGLQFCEEQSQRCRSCIDFAEDCFKNNRHISNCSEFCLDTLKKNISETDRTILNCSASDGYRWLPEEHHLLIESILTCIIMTGVAFCLLCKFQLLPDFIKNIYALQKEKGKVITVVDENLEMNMKQPLMSDQKEQEANNHDEKLKEVLVHGKCGVDHHNQISNATKDDPSLCFSGRRADPTAT